MNSSGVFAAVAVVDAKAPSDESRTQGSEEGAPGSLPVWNAFVRLKKVDCKTVVFFFSKSVKKSVKRGVRVLSASVRRPCEAREKKRLSPVSLSVFSLVADLLFDFRAYLNLR